MPPMSISPLMRNMGYDLGSRPAREGRWLSGGTEVKDFVEEMSERADSMRDLW
jgi:hypothetical protein